MIGENFDDSELSLDELENIVGGYKKEKAQLSRMACEHCGEICMVDLMKPSFTCAGCKKFNYISG